VNVVIDWYGKPSLLLDGMSVFWEYRVV